MFYTSKNVFPPTNFYCIGLNSIYFSYLYILPLHVLESRNDEKEQVKEDGNYNLVSTFYILGAMCIPTFLYLGQTTPVITPTL